MGMAEQDTTKSRPLGEPSRLRVLLIEDDPGDAYLVRDLLESGSRDFEVTWVHNIAEATSALTEAEFDCALLDLGLPDSEGLDTLHRLHKVNPRTAAVVLTGIDDQIRGDPAPRIRGTGLPDQGDGFAGVVEPVDSLRHRAPARRGDRTPAPRRRALRRRERAPRTRAPGASDPRRRRHPLGHALSARRSPRTLGRGLLRRHPARGWQRACDRRRRVRPRARRGGTRRGAPGGLACPGPRRPTARRDAAGAPPGGGGRTPE